MKRTMTKAERFFWKHAGTGYKPAEETKAQGRRRGAEELAKAEEQARNLGWEFEWSDDWDLGCSHAKFFSDEAYPNGEPETCENCVVRDADGRVWASLGCIDDADQNYRRVIEAELASEALAEYDREIEVLDAH